MTALLTCLQTSNSRVSICRQFATKFSRRNLFTRPVFHDVPCMLFLDSNWKFFFFIFYSILQKELHSLFKLGLTSTRNYYGEKVVTREAGSKHDPDLSECSPPTSQGGSYLMFICTWMYMNLREKNSSRCWTILAYRWGTGYQQFFTFSKRQLGWSCLDCFCFFLDTGFLSH